MKEHFYFGKHNQTFIYTFLVLWIAVSFTSDRPSVNDGFVGMFIYSNNSMNETYLACLLTLNSPVSVNFTDSRMRTSENDSRIINCLRG